MKQPEAKEIKKIEEKINNQSRGGKKMPRVILKVIAVNVVNLVLIAAIFYFLGNMDSQAEKIKELRSASIIARETSDVAIIKSDIDKTADKIDRLKDLYVDDNRFGDFIQQVNAIKGEGVITQFDFPGGAVVTEGKLRGYPLLLVFQGTKEAVNNALSRVMTLPYLLSPESVEVELNPESVTVSFGALILVNENFSEN
jgi:hypothetical protein